MGQSLLQAILALPFSWRQRQLAAKRPPMKEGEFIDRILAVGGDAEAARFVRNELLDWVYVPNFTPYPDDSLSRLFGIAEEELDEDLIQQMFKSLAVALPPAGMFRHVGTLDTPSQLAKLVNAARQQKGQGDRSTI